MCAVAAVCRAQPAASIPPAVCAAGCCGSILYTLVDAVLSTDCTLSARLRLALALPQPPRSQTAEADYRNTTQHDTTRHDTTRHRLHHVHSACTNVAPLTHSHTSYRDRSTTIGESSLLMFGRAAPRLQSRIRSVFERRCDSSLRKTALSAVAPHVCTTRSDAVPTCGLIDS